MASSQTDEWRRIQESLKGRLICEDREEWAEQGFVPKLIGGLDISYFKDDTDQAYVTLVVLDKDNGLKTVYCHSSFVPKIRAPYIPGFLAFREVPHLIAEIDTLKGSNPELLPDVILIDGNGLLHPLGFGSACQFGVLVDLPSIGVAKNPFYLQLNEEKMRTKQEVKDENKEKCKSLEKVGDFFEIKDEDEKVVGVGLKTDSDAERPVYVSIGHRICLETAIATVLSCCRHKVPEPIRRADFISRENIRNHVDNN